MREGRDDKRADGEIADDRSERLENENGRAIAGTTRFALCHQSESFG